MMKMKMMMMHIRPAVAGVVLCVVLEKDGFITDCWKIGRCYSTSS